MEGWVIGVLALAAIAGITLFILGRKKAKKEADLWKLPAFDRARKIKEIVAPVKTPAGHNVYFEQGTDRSVFSLPACDAGIEKSFQKAECAGYVVDRSKHNISIFVFNSEPDSNGDPAYKIFIKPGNYYYGSEWDKKAGQGEEVDHYILAAAETVAIGDPLGDWIVVPHHSGKEAHLSTVCEYELEHISLAYHNGPRFEETKNHGNGQGHPLLSDCPGMAMFTSRPFKGTCGGAVI